MFGRLMVVLSLFISLAAFGAPRKGELPFPLPTTVRPEDRAAYQAKLLEWLNARSYATLKWAADKGIRDTGPWINDVYYGTHKAARIYYSPAVMKWLEGGRKTAIPDGAMIIKEQYDAPAARWETKTPPPVSDWTIMIKDAKGSADGWFWAELWVGMTLDNHAWPFNYPNTGFGIYCTRCHASAEKESTFAALNNIAGYRGDPLTFRVDDSWRNEASGSARHATPPQAAPPTPIVAPNPAFLEAFRWLAPVAPSSVVKLPNETWDHVVANS
ncbi:MAG: cytochrome P460 family protein [Acidobacteriota bacterium]|nr:cytochrome P460 family protein [Acidobacteriota bacterium]